MPVELAEPLRAEMVQMAAVHRLVLTPLPWRVVAVVRVATTAQMSEVKIGRFLLEEPIIQVALVASLGLGVLSGSAAQL